MGIIMTLNTLSTYSFLGINSDMVRLYNSVLFSIHRWFPLNKNGRQIYRVCRDCSRFSRNWKKWFTYFALLWIYLSGVRNIHIFRDIQLSAKTANYSFVPAEGIEITFFKENSFTRMVCKYIHFIFQRFANNDNHYLSYTNTQWTLKMDNAEFESLIVFFVWNMSEDKEVRNYQQV